MYLIREQNNTVKFKKTMTAEKAAALYQKLSPFLRKVDSFGYYSPVKKANVIGFAHSGQDQNWPLLHKNYPNFPISVTWNPKRKGGTKISFEQFLLVYGIKIVE